MDQATSTLETLAIFINWTVVLVGMPHQVYTLFKTKKVGGLSITTFSLYLIAFVCGLAYGLEINNNALIYGNIPTVLFSTIILGQIIYYKFFKYTA